MNFIVQGYNFIKIFFILYRNIHIYNFYLVQEYSNLKFSCTGIFTYLFFIPCTGLFTYKIKKPDDELLIDATYESFFPLTLFNN